MKGVNPYRKKVSGLEKRRVTKKNSQRSAEHWCPLRRAEGKRRTGTGIDTFLWRSQGRVRSERLETGEGIRLGGCAIGVTEPVARSTGHGWRIALQGVQRGGPRTGGKKRSLVKN